MILYILTRSLQKKPNSFCFLFIHSCSFILLTNMYAKCSILIFLSTLTGLAHINFKYILIAMLVAL